MRVPAAKSSASWVQPCSMTMSGRAPPSKPEGSKSLKPRVPEAPVKLLATNRPAGEPTAPSGLAGSRSGPSSSVASGIVRSARPPPAVTGALAATVCASAR